MTERWAELGLRDAALRGDTVAWRTLVTSHAEPLRRYLTWRLGGRSTPVDDLVQETWLQVARSLHRFQPDQGGFEAWLLGIGFHVLRNYLRKESRLQRLNHRQLKPSGEPDDSLQAARITDALAALPESYERVLRAKYLDSLSVACIARQWKQTEKAIESLLTRARQAFREHYQKALS